MKLIVAGSRDFIDMPLMTKALLDLCIHGDLKEEKVEIVSGMARGADALAWAFAKENNVKCHEFPADWDTHGRRAGYVRNAEMANFSDALLVFWDGESRGTKNMMDTMIKQGKPIWIVHYLLGKEIQRIN